MITVLVLVILRGLDMARLPIIELGFRKHFVIFYYCVNARLSTLTRTCTYLPGVEIRRSESGDSSKAFLINGVHSLATDGEFV